MFYVMDELFVFCVRVQQQLLLYFSIHSSYLDIHYQKLINCILIFVYVFVFTIE